MNGDVGASMLVKLNSGSYIYIYILYIEIMLPIMKMHSNKTSIVHMERRETEMQQQI